MKQLICKRILPLILAIVLAISCVPTTAFAIEAENVNTTSLGGEDTTMPGGEDTTIPGGEDTTTLESGKSTIPNIGTLNKLNKKISIVNEMVEQDESYISALKEIDFELINSGCDFYNLIQQNNYGLASGAVESEIILNDVTGSNRNVIHIIEVDLKDPNISVMPTYKGIREGIDFEDSNNWGSQVLTEQAAHVENDLGLNVVGGINTNLRYNSDHPYGVLVWNGVVYSDERNANGVSTAQTYLVVDKEGRAELRSASEPLNGTEWQAISANFGWIIKDGVSQYTSDDHTDSSRAPRTVIGIKENGNLILMMNDGRQAPFSAGMSMRELAEVLLAMGCVDAVNCDGGGSSTFISEREGTGELTMKSSPSDGGQRATLGGLLVISNAVKDGKFHHAAVQSTEEYVTPESSVTFTAVGSDSAGGAAEIPEDVEWQLEDRSFGTVENGVFVSNGKTGTVVVQMVYNGEVVGEDSVNVVIPEAITFSQQNITVPYGKTASLDIEATVNNGLNTVTLKEEDIIFELSDSGLGTIAGFEYTACDEDAQISGGTITVTLICDTTVTASANLNLGKGSNVVWDFEDGDISSLSFGTGYGSKHKTHPELGRFEKGYIEVVDSTTGMVKNGEKALAVICDWSGFYAMGYNMLKLSGLDIDMADAVGVGFWVYLTPEATGCEFDLNNAIPFNSGDAGSEKYAEDGWYYVYAAKEDGVGESFNNLSIYQTDGYDAATSQNIPNIKTKHTLYIDDITVDYSTVVEDREAPIFNSIGVLKDADTYTDMNGQTVTSSTITVMAEAQEDTTKNNYTGLDIDSAKVYIDGVELTNGFVCATNGAISVDNITLSDGIHTFRFEIADNAGNYRSITRQITVDASEEEPKITLVPKDPVLDKLPIGSMYWMDLKAANIENVESVAVEIDLDGMNDWQLDYIEVAEGFTVEYMVDDYTNNATLLLTRTEETATAGSGVLVSMPIRVWEYTLHIDHPDCLNDGQGVCNFISTPAEMWSGDGQFRIAVCVSAAKGEVTFKDGNEDTFSSEKYVIDTEMDKHRNLVTQAEKEAKTSWHIHVPTAVEDKEATCTGAGYTGRTVCTGCSCGNTADEPCDTFDGCGSVVDWGTTIPATGHVYTVKDGKLACECGKIEKANGLYVVEEKTYYVQNGNVLSGWFYVEVDGKSDYYYFYPETYHMATGACTVEKLEYTFDDSGRLIRGAFSEESGGTRYYYAGRALASRWIELEEGTYWADKDGYIVYGDYPTLESAQGDYVWYHFNENTGLLERTCDGFVEYKGQVYYCEDGSIFYGAIKVDDNIIFTSTLGLVVKNNYCWVDECKGCTLTPGNYYCDENGYIVGNGFVTIKDGDYYYSNYEKALGFTKVKEGYYYFNKSSGKMYKDITLWVGDNDYGIAGGYYYFQEDGTMYIPDPNGLKEIVKENEKLYFTVAGVKQTNGLNELDGEYYYAKTNGELVVGITAWVSQKNGLILEKGNWYAFDEEGKMQQTGFVHASDGSYYYDELELALGFTKIGEEYYYFNKSSGKMYKDVTLWVGDNDYGIAGGYYYFQEDGTMYIPDPNGPKEIVKENEKLYFIVDGVKQTNGLNELDGEYYYAKTNGELVVGTTVWVSQKNGLIPEKGNWYAFDGEGKMQQTGFVHASDGSYYYDELELALGFTKIGEEYYYFNKSSGKMYKDITLWVGDNDYGIAGGYYYFQEDGTMYIPDPNGPKEIVKENEKLYFIVAGVKQTNGLNELDGEYYYAKTNGELVVGTTAWVSQKNGLIPEKGNWYAFDEEGKMQQTGFVHASDGSYYYDELKLALGFTKIGEEYYYFNKSSGKMYKDITLWIGDNEYSIIGGMYEFGSEGKMIK